jgi:hypothetical protein
MQLRPWAAVAVAGAATLSARRAEPAVEAATHLTVFREASDKGSEIQVVHPQADVSADLGKSMALAAGYEVDIVSGATPAVYGSATPDAVTGATAFSDQRQQARAGVTLNTRLVGLTAGYSYGWEKDYRSHTVSAAARGDFLEKNFTLSLSYTRNFDSVCDQNNEAAQGPLDLQPLASSENCFKTDVADVVTRSVAVHTFEPALVWTATPRLLLQGGATLQVADGFQSNPYRRVVVGSQGRSPQEHVPTLRQRYAVFVRGRLAIPEVRAAVSGMGRLYRDTWDVRAATVDAEAVKYLGPNFIVGVHGRYHTQGGAIFYRPSVEYRTLGPVGRYWTGDRELAPLQELMGGVKAAYLRRPEQDKTWYEELEFNVKFDLLFYSADPGAPNADRRGASVLQLGFALRL